MHVFFFFPATPSVVLLCTLCERAVKRCSIRLGFGDCACTELKSLLCGASSYASSFVEWHISWWEHLFEDLENMIVTNQRSCRQQCVAMWWISNGAYLAVAPNRSY